MSDRILNTFLCSKPCSNPPSPPLSLSFRLSGDVQDLKSSFKLVISQGLRSITQGAGCLVSLYIISPQMTGGVCVVLPAIILVGTMFGSVLRKWSRNAQEQVAIATGVADEAIGNIRTVRAFAMEESEHRSVCACWIGGWTFFHSSHTIYRLYQQQLMKSEWASVKLGNGIALFQALSNLAINGQCACTSRLQEVSPSHTHTHTHTV